MHFFWRGDMPHFSPPLPFGGADRGARECWRVASPRPRRGLRSWALAGGARAWHKGHSRSRWPTGPCPRQGSWSYVLASGASAPHPGRGSRSYVLAGVARDCALGMGCEQQRLSARPCTPLVATAPRFSPVYAPLLVEFFHFLTDISV